MTSIRITERIFAAFTKCRYKAKLIAEEATGVTCDYAQLETDLDTEYRKKSLEGIARHYGDGHTAYSPALLSDAVGHGYQLIISPAAAHGNFIVAFEALEREPSDQATDQCRYSPLLFLHREKLTACDRLLVAFHASVLSDIQHSQVAHGRIVHGRDAVVTNVSMAGRSGPTAVFRHTQHLIDELAQQLSGSASPSLLLNDHCSTCEFTEHCRAKVVESDSLTLLRGIGPREIARHNGKGIFTVKQLSYTFRQRRRPKRQKEQANPHNFALQALAIRENKVHIHGNPSLPLAVGTVYLDIEGVPDRDVYYLIGVLVAGSEEYHGFWADDESQQDAIFAQLADFMAQHGDHTVLHYGNYETKALRRILGRMDEARRDSLERVLLASRNVLSLITPHIYFPTTSNGLKDISAYLGFQWTVPAASGLHSILWRKQWEITHDVSVKDRLMQYNREDCLALQRVAGFIASVTSDRVREHSGGQDKPDAVVYTADLRPPAPRTHRWGKPEFCLPDLAFVNKCAYFDYQRDKVSVRADGRRTKGKSPGKSRRPRRIRINRHVDLRCSRCPHCGTSKILRGRAVSTKGIDLKFFNGGVKRWVTEYSSWRYRCRKCKNEFKPPDYPNTRVLYGNGIMSWVLYRNAACGENMLRVSRSFKDIFQLDISQPTLYRFKAAGAERYHPTADTILAELLRGPSLHVDETEVKLRSAEGYVWVFAGSSGAYYEYRGSRNGQFLSEMLKSFSGVLVTDFFTAYDSLHCPQQKCLIHLMRDMNDDLRANAFDGELRSIVHRFAVLLRSIIETVDRYGMTKRHLHKHKKAAMRFVEVVTAERLCSDTAMKYQKRIDKYGQRLFTFLDYDNVPWNNNNAEHAIHSFARHRRFTDGLFTEGSLADYLTIQTVFQTCEYRDKNVLEFLLSGTTAMG